MWEFKKQDTDRDRILSDKELEVMAANRREPCMKPLFKSCDSDSDGAITHGEWCCCMAYTSKTLSPYCCSSFIHFLGSTSLILLLRRKKNHTQKYAGNMNEKAEFKCFAFLHIFFKSELCIPVKRLWSHMKLCVFLITIRPLLCAVLSNATHDHGD